MPRNQTYQPREDPRDSRVNASNELMGGEPDIGSMVRMLSELYGIQQEQENNPHKQAHLDAESGESQARSRYYDAETRQKDSVHAKMMDDIQSMSFLFGSPDKIPDGIKKAMLQRAGYNPDDAFTPPPQGEMTSQQIKGPAAQHPSAIGGLTPARGMGEYNWLRNEVGVPIQNALTPATNKLRGVFGLDPYQPAKKRPNAINPFTGK